MECWTPFKTSKESFPLDSSLPSLICIPYIHRRADSLNRRAGLVRSRLERRSGGRPIASNSYRRRYLHTMHIMHSFNSLSFSHWFSFHFHVFLPPLAPSYHTRSPVVSCSISCLCFSDSGSCTSGQRRYYHILQSFHITSYASSTTLSIILFCHPPP